LSFGFVLDQWERGDQPYLVYACKIFVVFVVVCSRLNERYQD